jgi:hypothetical protein
VGVRRRLCYWRPRGGSVLGTVASSLPPLVALVALVAATAQTASGRAVGGMGDGSAVEPVR